MIGRIIGVLWTLVKLPVKLVLLPYKIVSFVISMAIYALVLAALGGVVYFVII